MDITIESDISLVRLAALQSIQIRDVEINPVHCFMACSTSHSYICLMILSLS